MKNSIRLIILFCVVLLSGCASHAIVPFRMTYTYPVAEACQYPTVTACGAVAFWNDKTIALYLPYQKNTFEKRPARYEFTSLDAKNETWIGKLANTRNDADIHAHFILSDQAENDPRGFRATRGMLIVDFPNKQEIYGELAGKTIWLTPSVGWENVKQIRGLFWESDSKLPESLGVRFSKD